MQINLSTRHGQLSAASQEKIREKIAKLARFHDRISSATVIVDLGDEQHPDVEIKVSAERAGQFVSSERADSLMAAVDSAVHKIEQQLRKNKEKKADRHRSVPRREPLGPQTEGETEASA